MIGRAALIAIHVQRKYACLELVQGAQGAAQINRPSENGQIQTHTRLNVKCMNKHTSPWATRKKGSYNKHIVDADNSDNKLNKITLLLQHFNVIVTCSLCYRHCLAFPVALILTCIFIFVIYLNELEQGPKYSFI